MKPTTNIGISCIEYSLPKKRQSLHALSRQKLITSPISQLKKLGFKYSYTASPETSFDLAHSAVKKLLKNCSAKPDTINLVIYTSALNSGHFTSFQSTPKHLITINNRSSLFTYPVSKLQHLCGLINSDSLALAQQGCIGLSSCIKLSLSLFTTENYQRIVCISSDVLPSNANREIVYNLISDGAVAILLERNPLHHQIITHHQISKPFFWNGHDLPHQLIATYFPTATNLVNQALTKAGLTVSDLDLIIPHNVNLDSWLILARLLDFPPEKIFTNNIASHGHIISADNFINLKTAIELKRLKPGNKYLLFNFGFGAHWSATILKY